jgi:hypothetical protein
VHFRMVLLISMQDDLRRAVVGLRK